MSSQVEKMTSRIPVTLITGFLGSGKTTLLSKVLSHSDMKNAAVIINEFGEVGIDHLLVAKSPKETVLLSNGCLCCASKGDLIQALESLTNEMRKGEIQDFDRVIIESTGFADPIPVVLAVATDPDLSSIYRMDGVVTVVDALNIPNQLNEFPESTEQITTADRLLISKVDLLETHAYRDLTIRLQNLNPGAGIHPVVHGEIDVGLLFNLSLSEDNSDAEQINKWLNIQKLHTSKRHSHPETPEGTQSAQTKRTINSFTLVYERNISRLGFQLWMDMLGSFRGPNLLRLKGLLNVEGSPVIVQAVQHLFHPPVKLDAWPDKDHRSKLVFITRGVSKKDVERSFEAFAFTSSKEPVQQLIKNDGFKRLLKAQSRFYAAEISSEDNTSTSPS